MKNSNKDKKSSESNRSYRRRTLSQIALTFESILNELKNTDKEYTKESALKYIKHIQHKYESKTIPEEINSILNKLETRCNLTDIPLY